MASRRQKQLDRKYSSYRKYTATEDVNYSTHSSRSSFRSESLTSRADGRGRSTSSEIVAGSDTRSYPVYIAIQDFNPDKEDLEAIPLEQGQIVEVLDKKNSVRWLVRTKARPPRSGWVPGSYFETPTEYYKQRRRTREIEGPTTNLTEEQAAVVKRDQVYHDLLRSEEEFVGSLRSAVDNYVKVLDDPNVPDIVKENKEKLTINVPEIYNFHANVMLKGLNYYSDDPSKVGQTFVRLEQDFETHVEFYKQLSTTLALLETAGIKEFFQSLADKCDAGASTYADHIREIADRMNQYQNYFKEFVKYSARTQHSSKSIQKALELITTIPQRVHDLEYTNRIVQYPGDTNKLGRIIRHDAFQVQEGDEEFHPRYVFLFRNKIMFTEELNDYVHQSTIRLDKYTIRSHTADPDTIVLQPNEPGLPSFRMKPKDSGNAEYVTKAWLKDIAEEQEIYATQKDTNNTTTTTHTTMSDFEVSVSDARSEFSEWSGSRKSSSSFGGPEEGGPPRKKVKSPPVISPTGSSTSIYSGGSSSIDWTTTGTTLEMQGTRVTRTQYGFRTLQESSAKMCLKVTGYPLPDITWYKDDVLLHEDERHTFYSDEDGFFAMTIDPVHVDDTGRYTCMATNEYGQASTSAFFRVLKVEKEAAPPAFVTKLADQECKEGDVINFECEVEGWPEPELLWLVDDQPLRPSQDFRLQYDGQHARLEIRDAQPDDTGVYKVKIQNEFGSVETAAELLVQPDPDKNHVAPEFQATIDDVECDEGAEVRFKSVITGDPNPEIVWLINGQPLSESEKVRFISEDGICILTIKDVSRHFDGVVTCQGANRLGTTSCEGRLKVRVPPAPPTFTRPLEDKTVTEKNSVSFEVDVAGWPEPSVEFSLAGKKLVHGVEGVEIVGHDGLYRLTINDANLEKHDGELVARAQNQHGTAESRARLTVEPVEELSRSAPTFIKDIEDQTVKHGEQAVFETSVRGNPNPEVTWYINGHKMDQSSPGVKIEVINHDHKITIDSAQYAGTVLCRAENVVGRFETKAKLTVVALEKPKRAPRFTETLSDRTETEGASAVFEVKVEGEPKPEVTWYLNGRQLVRDERTEMREFDGSIKLELKNVRLDEGGEIRAVAKNSEGTDETRATLTVAKKPSAPVFDRAPKSATVERGTEAVFEAHADATPAPTYTWAINGRKVREGLEGARASATADGGSMLVIDTSVHSADTITVSVSAENSLGADEAGARLTVEAKKISTTTEESKTQEITTDVIRTDEQTTVGSVEVELEASTTTTTMETTTTSTTTTKEMEMVVEMAAPVTVEQTMTVEQTRTTTMELGGGEKTAMEAVAEETTTATEAVVEETKKTTEAAVVEETKTMKRRVSFAEDAKGPQTETEKTPASPKKTSPPPEPKKESPPESPKKASPPPASPKKTSPPASPKKASPEPKRASPSPSEEKKEDQPVSPKKTSPPPTDEKKTSPKKASPEPKKESPPASPKKASPTPASPKKTSPEPTKTTSPPPASPKEEPSLEVKKASPPASPKKASPPASPKKTSPPASPKKASPPASPKKKKSESPKKTSPEPTKVEPTTPDTKVSSPPASPKKAEVSAKEKTPPKKTSPEPTKTMPPAPQLTRDLKAQTVTKSDLAHFEVVVEHATQVRWFHDGVDITNSKDVTVSSDAFEFRVSINTDVFGSGVVSVVASNETGSLETKTELTVLPPKETNKPEFTDKLKDVSVKKGDSIQMDVIALHSPQYRWYLNGTELKDGVDGVTVRTVENKSTLTIANVAQAGTIKVEAFNDVGSSESTGSLTLQTAPTILDGPTSVTVTEKQTAEFKVTVTGFPEPTVRWTINETTVVDSQTVKVTKTETTYSLKITETMINQAGTVKVTAENAVGSDSKTAELKVEKAKPSFKTTLTEKTATVGESVRWEVSVDGAANVEWLLNGAPLTAKTGVDADGNHFAQVDNVTADFTGTITAKATNEAGSDQTSANLTVASGDRKPEFVKSPQNHEANIGESVKFSAIVAGSPMPRVSWFLNGQRLENNDEVKVKYEQETGKTSIRILNPQMVHNGTVRVEADNVAGKVDAEVTLKVDKKTEVPKFTTNMDDRQVNEGDNVKYTADVDGYPEPTVAWTINGQPVGQFPNITVTDENGQHTIEIKNIAPDQSGELSCEATNAVGSKKRDVQLIVKRVGQAPTFKKNLEDLLVTEGEITKMEAILNETKPTPTITWLRDDKPLVGDDHVTLTESDGTLTLKIVTTKLDDKGRITIKAENEFGAAECSASLGVVKGRPMNKPAFQSTIPPINLTEGDTLDCKLLITGDPTPFVKWYINGQLVCATEDTEMTNANGVFTLKIHGCTADMTGKIKCVAYNKAGEVSTEGPLKVIAPIPVEFETSLCDATCREGDTLKLKAVLLGEPTPVVSWYINGKKLEESQNIKIHAEKGTYTVTIKDITCDYSGKVVCEAVNEYGRATSEAVLLVLPRGEPPDFIEWLSNVRARVDTKVVHKVVFTGDPKPTLTWYINNQEVRDGPEYTIVTDDKTSVLTINKFNPDKHVGEIICKAENDAGEVSCTANMVSYTSDMFSESESEAQEIFGADDATEDESLRDDDHHRTPTPVNAPRFITKIKDTKAKKGHEAIFECVVPDTKGVCCKWLKDGKEIELIARIRVQTRTGPEGHITQQLIIDQADLEDAGRYTCIVENSAGTDRCEATLTVVEVIDKAPAKAPEFTVALQDKTIKVGEKAVLECKVHGEPAPKITWLHDNKVVSTEVTVESVEGVERLTVETSKITDQGRYTCIAENSEGTTKTESFLTVTGDAPIFTKQLQDKSVTIGEKLVLSCSVQGNPQPHVEFFSVTDSTTTKMVSSSRVAIEHDASNVNWRLVIQETSREQLTSYKAVATNVIGTATSSATVSAKTSAPVFEQGLKNTTVHEKETVEMEVKVGGSEPEVRFFKDGKELVDDDHHQIKKEQSGRVVLVIKEATMDDGGAYSAKATNPAGTVETTADVDVCKAAERPVFVKELVQTEVKISDTATLSVTVKGVPEPTVEWLKNGQPVGIDGEHVVVKADGHGSHTITINTARFDDTGVYSCKATNTAGQAYTEAKFAVIKVYEAPEFTEKLNPVEVKEKTTVQLSVTVVGTPAPEVVWIKDGAPVTIDGNHVVAKAAGAGHYTLTINEATSGDVGVYTCKATNEAGEATTTANFAVARSMIPPEFTEKLKPMEVKEQQTLNLSVTVVGTPAPEVKWIKDGAPVAIDGSHVIAKDDANGHHTLVINEARAGDVGVYSCVATNEAGEAKTTANLAVQEDVVAPHFIEGLKTLEADEGKPIELHVQVEGKPEPEVTWLKDGAPINIDGSHVIAKDAANGHHTLVIKEVAKADVGSYTCQVVNKAGRDESIGELKIPRYSFEKTKEESVEPLFVEPLTETVAGVGETVVLACRVNKESHPEVRFFKDGHPIVVDSSHMVLEVDDDGGIKLIIHDSKSEDVGAYKCQATNRKGKADTNATLQFATMAEGGAEEEAAVDIESTTTTAATASESEGAPEFVELLRSATVIEKKAILKCKVIGHPKPTIKWTKDGKEVVMSTRIRAEDNNGLLTLTIDDVTEKDIGEYRCEATNVHGSAWTEAPIVWATDAVVDGEAPDFVQPVKPANVAVGQTAVLEGKVSGRPKPTVKWYKNGKELTASDRILIDNLPDGTQRLTVKDAKMEDKDEYRCEASNEFGDVWSDVTLTVTQPAPTFLKELTATSVKEQQTATFECKVAGEAANVIWFKDGVELKNAKTESSADGTQKLIVEKTSTQDQGNYRVEVSNDAGTINSKAPLTVTPAEVLRIKKELTDVTVTKGSRIILSVEVEGRPKTVKWYRGSEQVSASSTTKIEKVTDHEYKLEIESADVNDAAVYRVVLSTDSQSVESSGKVTVTEKKVQLPSFKSGLSDQTVPKGAPLVLEVEIEGSPKDVKWYKNGKEIPGGEDLGNGKFRLTVPDFDDKDVGDYSVTAANDAGEIDSKAKVTVKDDGKDKAKPEIVSGLVPTSVSQGDTAKFTVKTKGPVKDVKWYKNGKQIPNPKTTDNGDGVYELELPNAQLDDAADYKVVVGNDAGDAESSAALTVKLPAIKIVDGLEDKTADKGAKVKLQIETSKKPKTVKWYKNGKEIPDGVTTDGNKPSLTIPADVDADFKVVVEDEDGNVAESSCRLTVKLPEKPTIKKGLEDQTVPVGSPIKLAIETTGSPKTVKWYKNGKELTAGTKKVDDNTFTLDIPSGKVDDSGDYKVVVANDAGEADSNAAVSVEPKITFLKPLKDTTVVEGEDAEFVVETNVKPRTVKWYKNGQEIVPNDHFKTTSVDTKHKLVVKTTTKDDAADYKVVLVNSAGEVDSSAKLTVNKPKSPVPKILKGLDDQVVAKGDDLVFEVKIEGEPTEVRWLKDGKPVGANAVIEKVDDKTYRLTIPKADVSDAGDYTVEAINESGKAKSEAKTEVDVPPTIVNGLVDKEVSVGDDDVLKVEVSAPVRTVKWYKNGQELKPSAHLEQKKVGPKKFELTINKAALDDGADYKVVLGNAAGECESSAALTVTKPNLLKVVEGLKDVEVDEGEPIKLTVKVEGIPKTVKWYKNGQEMTAPKTEQAEDGAYSLLIPTSTKSDSAAYRVVLSNDKGEVYSGSVAHVKPKKKEEPKAAAFFLTPLSDVDVEEGDMLTLECVVGGEPFPEVRWEKDGVPVVKDDRVAIRVALDGKATLRIKSARKDDLGAYKVIVTNESGTSSSDCKVNVKDRSLEPSEPKFVIPLRHARALIGEKVEFNVKVRAVPAATLEWTLNGAPLKLDSRVRIDDMADGNWCLTIADVKPEDFGELRCVAKNPHGQTATEALFSEGSEHDGRGRDDLRYPPRFNVPLWDRRIPDGDPMFIECHVDANPHATIEWFFDGKKVETSGRFEIRNSSDGACRLNIVPFSGADVGRYMCVAVNELGQAETQATYSVETFETVEEERKKEYAPRFNPGLEDRAVAERQTVRLSCKVDAIPRASVVWYKDGLPLRPDSRILINYDDDGNASLQIESALDADAGAYRCVATNSHGTTNTSCTVGVKVQKTEVVKEGAEPFFTKGLVDLWADRGDSFTMKCAVTGDPMPDVKWYRNGQLVRNGPRTTIEMRPDGECTLTVTSCTMSDEGVYRCEAENKHGKAKTQATSHVQMALGKTEKPKIDDGKPPKFIVELFDTSVTLGAIIDLECKVTGAPQPNVKWSKDGGPLWDDPRYDWNIDEAKGAYQLRIKNATVHDEGTYRCVATNENGSATTKSFVRIDDGLGAALGAQKTQPPRFTIKLGDTRAVEGQPLKLECKVDASPLPEMVWYKDGAIVSPSDRVQISIGADGTATLLIPSCVYDDDGIYRVIATNSAGTAQDKGNATVKRAARDGARRSAERDVYDGSKAPKLLEPIESVRCPEKQQFTLRCKFSGEPKPTIKWFKDGERVFPYGRLTLNEAPDGVCELTVDSAARQDAGGYRCVAENVYGSARTTGDVNVLRGERKPRDVDQSMRDGKAPGFTVPLTVKRAKPGETVTFECVPFGNPFPSIKWLKDGLELTPDANTTIEAGADGAQKLTLSSVTFLSEGYYRCVATNEHGTASTKAELVIDGDRRAGYKAASPVDKSPEECKPRIRRGLYNMSIHEGNVVEMIVCATGWPTPTVKWFKDGEEIISDGPDGKRVIFTDERGIHHLVIVNSNPDDEGEYSLEATNKLGSARTEGSLNIIRPRHVGADGDRGGLPFPPGFVRQLKNKHVFNHLPTIFDCLVVGHPPPDVEWFHNGKKIVPGGRIKIQSCGGGSHALIILDTTLEDAGEYVATAKNSHGTASSSAVLDVTVPFLDTIKFNGEIDVTPYLTEEYGFKKLNYASLPTPPDRGPFIKEVTGHYLTLSWIPTKRAPPRYPQVTYVIEIRELPEKEWTLLDYNIPEPVCKVRNLELGKSYQFRVRAENIYGISDPSPASPPSRLMAPPQPVFDRRTNKVIPLLDPYAERALDLKHAEQYSCAPWFAPGVVEKRYCAENDTLTVILNVSGYPDPDIKWKFRGWDIDTSSPTSKCKVYTYGGSETTLTISGFSKENVGQYQCFATNDYGEAQQNIMVEMATRPSFIQPLANKTFSSAHPMRLDVRVEGDPFPELKWMKEYRPIVESSRVKFVQDGPFLCSLVITDPMWRDSGIYSCVAINDAGQATSSCTVTVEADGDYNDVELPRRRVTIENRRVKELYEIKEHDEKLATSGAPFRVVERESGKAYLAQLRPLDETLARTVDVHNSIQHDNVVQYHRVIRDQQLALVVYQDATSTIDGLSSLAHPGVSIEPSGIDRETCVRVFIRQLLFALKHMHDMRIAHLDLRPEAILLQDTRLKLADFGQARRLLRGLITGPIKGTPEFVSPEIVRSFPLTLATDMWSVGTLAYVLLTGISPFHGDNDTETLQNVDRAKYDSTPLNEFSYNAGDFIYKLLLEIPGHRLTVDEALLHPWICDHRLNDLPLAADTLREFKYQHKWLERRVFVQQTPSEQILEHILGPSLAEAEKQPARKPQDSDLYDYLRIKPRPPPPADVAQYVPRAQHDDQPFIDEYGNIIPASQFTRPPPYYSEPSYQRPAPPPPPGGAPRPPRAAPEPILVDQHGRPIYELGRAVHDPSRRPVALEDREMQEKRRLIPQEKGETPTKKEPVKAPEQNLPKVPIRMIRGERRDIEEEIANRILSDISEEGSVAGSLGSLEDFEFRDMIHSRSSTPKIHESEPSTPTLTPENTVKEKTPKRSSEEKTSHDRRPLEIIPPAVTYPDALLAGLPMQDKQVLEAAENNPAIPVGAPLFLEGLHGAQLTVDTNHDATGLIKVTSPSMTLSPSPKSPRRSKPGTKSPILLSPGKEHSMEVLIATKRGKPGFLPPGELASDLEDEDAFMDERKKKLKPKDHDGGFRDQKDRLKNDDLDKYRPSNFYKENVDEVVHDIDDSPWDSHYQIGPDTYLMATRGAAFNSRVRDYRRELFGDGAPTVRQGFLGVRNRDITVRERRRYTDILRETQQNLQPKSQESSASLQRAPSANAVDRIRADIEKVAPSATKKNDDGTFAPIFVARLRDVYLNKGRSAVFESAAVGSPAPKVVWTFQGKILEGGDRYTIQQENNISRLTINCAAPYDLGEYTCTASNQFGSDKTTSRLISGDTPTRPGRPDCELSSDTELFVHWEAPEGPTYLEGITYRLDYRLAGPDQAGAPWNVISEHIDDEFVVIKHLEPLGVYQFRVTAKNGFGYGLPSLSSRIIQTHGKGTPKLQIDVLKKEFRLNVVSLPHKSSNQLGGISEESEEESAREVTSSDMSLQTTDPTKKFQISGIKFKGRFSVLRDAIDSSTESGAHIVAKIRAGDATDEYEALKECQHENVQKLVAAFKFNNFLYLFTERLYEDIFSRFVFNDYYTEQQVAMSIQQLTAALHFMHFRGFAHLDVNPHNVMFTSKRSWIVKLVDFGSAQKVSGAKPSANFDVKWAAPEVHVDGAPVTVQSDVWGMGIITFCLLGGFHPFTSEYDQEDEVKDNVLNVKCDPNLIPVSASQESLSFVTWALKKSPLRRMRTDEALSHKFLSTDPSMVRRREAVKYSSSRLRKTAAMTRQPQNTPTENKELETAYGN